MPNQRHTHIVLLLGLKSIYGRGILRGVMSYVRPSRNWKVSVGQLSLKDANRAVAAKPDGIIAEIFNSRVAKILDKSGIPCVDVSNIVSNTVAQKVCADNEKIGQLAAEHFLERGFTNFAYIGIKRTRFSKLREVGFAKVLHGCGQDYSVFFRKLDSDFFESNTLGKTPELLLQWLISLSKPVAIFACNDAVALIVNEACRQLDFHVPDEVGVLGVDNDEQFCELETPTISSIKMPLIEIGFEATRLLEDIMNGMPQQSCSKTMPPLEVILRQSSDFVVFEDEKLLEAMQYIKEHVDKPISVEEVCDALAISRRWLEKKIKKQMGHSPLDEIRRVHIERAKTLLLNSKMSLPEIAIASGFRSPERMSVIFKRLTGITPSKYRKTFSRE